MRSALTGSLVVHAAILAALMIVRAPMPVVIPGPESVQVSLLDPGALASIAAPTPAAAPAPEDEGVKLDEPKPQAKPEPDKPREETPRREKPREPVPPTTKPGPASNPNATTLPMAAIGGPGMRGSVSVDARDFEFAYYLRLVRDQIARNWSPPAGMGAGKPVQAVVAFRIARGGQITGVRVEETSGIDFFDQSAARAVRISDPLPPLPLGFPAGDLGVHFGFEYTGS